MAKEYTQLELHGEENIPKSGVLMIPNQLRFDDLLQLERLLEDRNVVYLIEHSMVYNPLLQAHLEKDDTEALEFLCEESQKEVFKRELHRRISDGDVLIFVPGETTTRPGQNVSVPAEVLKFITSAGAPLLPVYVDHPEDTCLSIETIEESQRNVLSFGRLLEREAANTPNFQENLSIASEAAYSNRPIFKSHLAYAVLRGLKKHGATSQVIDGFDGSELRYDKMLAVAIVLSKHIASQTNKKRVGIILPPGKAGLIANLAVLFSGKTPVNLNFTAGDKAVASSIKTADMDRFITVDPFVRKMTRFAWPPNKQLILMERFLPKMKLKIALWLGITKILSAGALARILKIPKKGGAKEAILLFTSGSSGDPKGVVLSHRNILANVNQFGSRIDLKSDDRILGCLPLFHSFGCTVTMWFPMIEGVDLVTYPSPIETPKLAELIEKYKISVLLATPTFLRGFLRKATPEQMASLKMIITGAEKLPAKLAEAFHKKFGQTVLEGYGLTETSPVSNVNLPDPLQDDPNDGKPAIANHRPGSVGQLLPGMALRITDPNTDEPMPLNQAGMIWLRGPNIFEGYLGNEEKTNEVIQNGWFKTGDIGRMDAEGFLYIEGRLSRFSKIAGEMVPHETLEAAINTALGFDSDSERKIAVVGVPDDAKGEAIVMLSAEGAIDTTDMRYKLLDQGIPALWIPKRIIDVEEIPHLASGKLDIKGCEDLARA